MADRAGKPRVLVIDDDRDVADSLALLIESFDAEVRVAYGGASGVALAAEFAPDVAFVDIRMTGMDGHATARALRARFGESCPKLVALTGLGGAVACAPTPSGGFDLALPKPVPIAAIEAILEGARGG